jgi:hypothetical protein
MGESDKDTTILSCYQIVGLPGLSVLSSPEALDPWLQPTKALAGRSLRMTAIERLRKTGRDQKRSKEFPLPLPFALY